jgi:hypothetical protein
MQAVGYASAVRIVEEVALYNLSEEVQRELFVSLVALGGSSPGSNGGTPLVLPLPLLLLLAQEMGFVGLSLQPLAIAVSSMRLRSAFSTRDKPARAETSTCVYQQQQHLVHLHNRSCSVSSSIQQSDTKPANERSVTWDEFRLLYTHMAKLLRRGAI